MKLIIDIPEDDWERYKKTKSEFGARESVAIQSIVNGTPLDDVKEPKNGERFSCPNCGFKADWYIPLKEDNTKESRGKSCSTCKNNDDEFSGECYECLKGIFDHYEAESEDKI